MKLLIVNADDFGLTRPVNRGILDAHHNGIVTSASLMAGGKAFDDAIAMTRRAARLSVGVHLVLCQGTPISLPSEIPTLVSDSGKTLWTALKFLNKLATGRIDLRQVELELRRQIVRVTDAGITPSHLDGHKHVHVLPGIADIVVRLAREFGIPSVRCPEERMPHHILWKGLTSIRTGIFKQYLAGRPISWLAGRLRVKLTRAGIDSPSHFFGLTQTGFLIEDSLDRILRSVPDGASELMCHPGYPDAALMKTGTRLIAQRELECRALVSPRIKDRVGDEGIELISYRDLGGAARSRESAVPDPVVKIAPGCARPV